MFYLCFNQTTNNIISQANQMEISGVSNDTIQSLNPIFYIVLNPLIQNFLFPFLSRRRISFGPVARMSTAFLFLAFGTAYSAGVQKLIYSRAPCFGRPLACDAAVVAIYGETKQYRPNEISAWAQIPLHFLFAIGEIFGFVALNEFAYTEAPTNMKALVKAFEQLAAAVGAAVGVALGPVSRDPSVMVLYSVLAGITAASGIALFATFRAYDASWYIQEAVDNVEEPSRTENTS
ncbi:oligopeptide transporter [Hypoxylon cercidicola]|nr:oligopeptide transporter [Hypoxylon cercidicola]